MRFSVELRARRALKFKSIYNGHIFAKCLLFMPDIFRTSMGVDVKAFTCDHRTSADTKSEYEDIFEDNDEITFSHFGFC